MDSLDVLQAATSFAESLSTIAVLVFAWLQATKRADRLEDDIIEDWKILRAQAQSTHD